MGDLFFLPGNPPDCAYNGVLHRAISANGAISFLEEKFPKHGGHQFTKYTLRDHISFYQKI
jgi:hypothetical protein